MGSIFAEWICDTCTSGSKKRCIQNKVSKEYKLASPKYSTYEGKCSNSVSFLDHILKTVGHHVIAVLLAILRRGRPGYE